MSLPWFYEDVRFDHGDAEAAIAALRRLRAQVEALGDVRQTAVDAPRNRWTGRFREDFDREFATTQSRLGTTCEQIDDTIRRIRSAADRAEADQAERVRRREDHQRELEERERAARTGGNVPR